MEISVAFATDQRNVADWPRSMELGSAVNASIRGDAGFAGGGASVLVGAGRFGGGGAGTGAFFLHPPANKISATANTVAPSVLLFIRILVLSLLKPQASRTVLVYPLRPHRLNVISLRCELSDIGSIGKHRIELRGRAPLRRKHDVVPIRRPPWIFVAPAPVCELDGNPLRDVHDEDVKPADLVASRPGK